jgi:hypothetical protein
MRNSLILAGIMTLAGSIGAGMIAVGGSANAETVLLTKRESSSAPSG